jgi:hypothetical protein
VAALADQATHNFLEAQNYVKLVEAEELVEFFILQMQMLQQLLIQLQLVLVLLLVMLTAT